MTRVSNCMNMISCDCSIPCMVVGVFRSPIILSYLGYCVIYTVVVGRQLSNGYTVGFRTAMFTQNSCAKIMSQSVGSGTNGSKTDVEFIYSFDMLNGVIS
jgi:hypothetical protein